MASPEQTEGLKLVGAWSKWLVAIQSAGIGLIASIVKDRADYLGTHHLTRDAFIVATFAFIVSIVVAVLVIGEIPTSLADILPGQSIWDRGIYWFSKCLCKFGFATNILLALFLIGISAFGFSLVFVMLGK